MVVDLDRSPYVFVHGYLSKPDALQIVLDNCEHNFSESRATIFDLASVVEIDTQRLYLRPKKGASLEGLAVKVDDKQTLERIMMVHRGNPEIVSAQLSNGTVQDLWCFNLVSEDQPIMKDKEPSTALIVEVLRTYLSSQSISRGYPLDRRWRGSMLHCLQAQLSKASNKSDEPPEQGNIAHKFKKIPIFRGYLRVDDVIIEDDCSQQTPTFQRRSVASWGDMAFVLPFDPVRREVLLVEQFRPGMLARGDSKTKSIGPIGGRIDKEERLTDAVRREAQEEAGLELGRLRKIPGYYSTPGLCTEHVHGFIGEANLEHAGGQYGNAWEGEHIRAFTVALDEALEMIDGNKISVSHGLISILYLAFNEETVRKSWLA